MVSGRVWPSQRVDGLGVGHTDEAGGGERDRRERGGQEGLWGGGGGWRATLMPAATTDVWGGTRVPICSPPPRHIHRQRQPPPPVPAAPSPPLPRAAAFLPGRPQDASPRRRPAGALAARQTRHPPPSRNCPSGWGRSRLERAGDDPPSGAASDLVWAAGRQGRGGGLRGSSRPLRHVPLAPPLCRRRSTASSVAARTPPAPPAQSTNAVG